MQKIILVQHCQSQHHLDRSRQYPDRGNGLTPLGRRQARAVADRLCKWFRDTPVSLSSSDMMRARETAEIIGSKLGCTPTFHAGLREWSDPSFKSERQAVRYLDLPTLGALPDLRYVCANFGIEDSD